MKRQLASTKTSLIVLVPLFLLLGLNVAQAELHHVYLSNDTKSTLIWVAVILAGGKIIAAAISKGPK